MLTQLFQAVVFDALFARRPLFVVIVAVHVVNRLVGRADEHRRGQSPAARKAGFFQLFTDVFLDVFRLPFRGVDIGDKAVIDLDGTEIEIDEGIGIVLREVAKLDAAPADVREHGAVERAVTLVGDEVAVRLFLTVEKIDADGNALIQFFDDPFEIFEIAHGGGGYDIAFIDARFAADLFHFSEIFRDFFHAALGEVFPLHVMQDGYVFPLPEQDVKRLFPFRRQERNAAGTDVDDCKFHMISP